MKTDSALEDSLGFNIYRAELLIRREFLKALSRYEMTPEQWSVLSILLQSDAPLSQQEIADKTLKDKFTTSRIVKRLERDGWITKKTDMNDKRSFLLKPTPTGLRLKTEIPSLLTRHFSPVFNQFSNEEYNRLIASLIKLRTILGDIQE